MIALRSLLKPKLASSVVRPLVARGFSLRVNAPPPEHAPVTAAPGYDIKEGTTDYQVDVNIPKGFTSDDVLVEIEPDKKHIHISGTRKTNNKKVHFEEHFASGHPLDLEHLKTDVKSGHLHVEAPKVHRITTISPVEPPSFLRTRLDHEPLTAAPGYDIKESYDALEVDMVIPQGFGPEDVAIKIEPDNKHVHITAMHGRHHFEKRFASGQPLDAEQIQTEIVRNKLHLRAPKVHLVAVPQEAPTAVIDVPVNEDPVTCAPGYDIKESMKDFQVDMFIPREFTPSDVSVEIGPNAKQVQVSGRRGKLHFTKNFTSGRALDAERLQTQVLAGHLRLEVPKM